MLEKSKSNKKRKKYKTNVSKEMTDLILNNLTSPISITDLSKKIHKDKSNVKKYIKCLKQYVEEKDKINSHGKCKIIGLKKKGYSYLGIDTCKKKKKRVTTKRLQEDYLNEDELEILNTMERNYGSMC